MSNFIYFVGSTISYTATDKNTFVMRTNKDLKQHLIRSFEMAGGNEQFNSIFLEERTKSHIYLGGRIDYTSHTGNAGGYLGLLVSINIDGWNVD